MENGGDAVGAGRFASVVTREELLRIEEQNRTAHDKAELGSLASGGNLNLRGAVRRTEGGRGRLGEGGQQVPKPLTFADDDGYTTDSQSSTEDGRDTNQPIKLEDTKDGSSARNVTYKFSDGSRGEPTDGWNNRLEAIMMNDSSGDEANKVKSDRLSDGRIFVSPRGSSDTTDLLSPKAKSELMLAVGVKSRESPKSLDSYSQSDTASVQTVGSVNSTDESRMSSMKSRIRGMKLSRHASGTDLNQEDRKSTTNPRKKQSNAYVFKTSFSHVRAASEVQTFLGMIAPGVKVHKNGFRTTLFKLKYKDKSHSVEICDVQESVEVRCQGSQELYLRIRDKFRRMGPGAIISPNDGGSGNASVLSAAKPSPTAVVKKQLKESRSSARASRANSGSSDSEKDGEPAPKTKPKTTKKKKSNGMKVSKSTGNMKKGSPNQSPRDSQRASSREPLRDAESDTGGEERARAFQRIPSSKPPRKIVPSTANSRPSTISRNAPLSRDEILAAQRRGDYDPLAQRFIDKATRSPSQSRGLSRENSREQADDAGNSGTPIIP